MRAGGCSSHNAFLAFIVTLSVLCTVSAGEPIDLGSRLELLVDHYLIDQISGNAGLRLHHPTPAEVAVTHDRPWEGNSCHYKTVFRDRDLYRMYYRGAHVVYTENVEKGYYAAHPEVVCYAESKDGIHWSKPLAGTGRIQRIEGEQYYLGGSGLTQLHALQGHQPELQG